MSRLQDLRVKGWPNLNIDEKREYQSLLAQEKEEGKLVERAKITMAAQEDSSEASDGDKPDLIQVDKQTLSDLIARIEGLEQEKISHRKQAGLYKQGTWKEIERKEKIRMATLRKYRPTTDDTYKYVFDLKFFQNKWNSELRVDEQLYQFMLYDPKDPETLKAGHQLVEIFSLKFFAASFEKEQVKLVDKRVKKMKQMVGKTDKIVYEYDKYKATSLGRVPMFVEREEVEFLVEMEDGVKFWLSADRLNL